MITNALDERLDDLHESAQLTYLISPGNPGPPAEDPLAVLREYLRAVSSIAGTWLPEDSVGRTAAIEPAVTRVPQISSEVGGPAGCLFNPPDHNGERGTSTAPL